VSEPTASRLLRGAEVLADPLVGSLVDARLVCVLATPEPNGCIHAVPMWFARDGDALVLATGSKSRKVGNLRRSPIATFVLHDSRPGMEVCGATIRGPVEVVSGPAAGPIVELVHRRYIDADAGALTPVLEFLASDDVALRLQPEEAFTWDERGSEAARVLRAVGGALALVSTAPR
jgi:PPOX class probable F420-dependent enzyme